MPVGEAESDVAFPRLSADQVDTIAAVGSRFDLEPGAMLYSAGDLDYPLVLVLSGATGPISSSAS
jgi:hypothetical protein